MLDEVWHSVLFLFINKHHLYIRHERQEFDRPDEQPVVHLRHHLMHSCIVPDPTSSQIGSIGGVNARKHGD